MHYASRLGRDARLIPALLADPYRDGSRLDGLLSVDVGLFEQKRGKWHVEPKAAVALIATAVTNGSGRAEDRSAGGEFVPRTGRQQRSPDQDSFTRVAA